MRLGFGKQHHRFSMREDIPRLAAHFVQERRYWGAVQGITPEALDVLSLYDWPDTVSHLQNVLKQALVLGNGTFIDLDDFPASLSETKASLNAPQGYYSRLRAFTPSIIEDALTHANGNHADAVRSLALSPAKSAA